MSEFIVFIIWPILDPLIRIGYFLHLCFFWKNWRQEKFCFWDLLTFKEEQPLIEYVLCIVTETTGLNLQKDQICQISAITEGHVLGIPDITGINRPNVGITNAFDIYLRPQVEFNSKASEINGMTKVITLQEPSSL